jgi:hypothetical protein
VLPGRVPAVTRTSVEAKRGCGYRKPGGLYLVGDAPTTPCAALPVPLDVCPACGAGVKPTRGWTWVIPDVLLAKYLRPHGDDLHAAYCPLGAPGRLVGPGEDEQYNRCGLLWVGESFYPMPWDFTAEAMRMGVSRRINAVPRGFKLGQWVLLAHRKAIAGTRCVCGFQHPPGTPCDISKTPLDDYGVTPGIFHLFRPRAIEYVVKGDETEEQLTALAKRDITPVRVVRAEGDQLEASPMGSPR